jgi:hypothetical protein
VVGALLAIALYIVLSLPDAEQVTPPIYNAQLSPEIKHVRSLDPARPDALRELQALMLDSDANVAALAGQRLALKYPEGFLALAAQAPNVAPIVRKELFDRRLTNVALELAALAVKTGSEQERAGGYLILKSVGGRSGPVHSRPGVEWELEEVFDALVSRIPHAGQAELADIESLMSRFHPIKAETNVALLTHESPLVRATAVRSLGRYGGGRYLAEVRALESDRDPRVRAEVKAALKTMVTMAKWNEEPP